MSAEITISVQHFPLEANLQQRIVTVGKWPGKHDKGLKRGRWEIFRQALCRNTLRR